jgi:hypothetical protein
MIKKKDRHYQQSSFNNYNEENQHYRYPFNHRRKREATSTIRNRYRQDN